MSSLDFTSAPLAAGSPLVPPPQRQLGQNPLLPQLPNTGDFDSTYLAAEGDLRAQIGRQYGDVLQQLGWIDENGSFIPGALSVQAGRQASNLTRSSDLAAEDVTNQAQRDQTLFSGRRALDTARAQFPYQQQISQLGVDIPLALGGLYGQAAGLIDQYTTQNNILLAAMAARRAAAIAQQPAGKPADQTPPTNQPPNNPPPPADNNQAAQTPGTTTVIPGTEGSTQTTFTPQERAIIDANPNALRTIGSDAAQSLDTGVTPVAGYGGDATAGQVARNTTDYVDPFYTPASYTPPEPTGFTPEPQPAPYEEPAPPPPEDSGQIFLATIPSDHPLLQDLMQIAQPAAPPAGYGGTRTAGQVRRNML